MKPFAYFRRVDHTASRFRDTAVRRRSRLGVDWIVVVLAVLIASGCGGGGCSGCGIEPIPGGFALAKRTENAGQVRVSTSGFAKITADPASVLGPLVGGGSGGVIEFPAPVSCGGSTPLCCDDNGNAIPNCGPIDIDLNKQPGDNDRLVLTSGGANVLNVTIRARVKTVHDLSVTLLGSHCKIGIDTTKKSPPADLQITTSITFQKDANNVTGIHASGTQITQLDGGDLTFGGDFLCLAGNLVPTSTIAGFLVTPIEDAINSATCKSCTAIADCAPGASACTGGTCMVGSACQQELGLDGRMRGSLLFGSLSPGTTGALDLYEVAGGYTATNEAGGGLSLGLLGGMEPGGTPRDMCGPAATEPAFVTTVPRSNYFSGNTRPDTSAAFDVAIGLYKSQLAQLAYGGYEGGLFCLTIGHNTVAQLTTDTISLLSRSLGKLVESNSPMAIGLRPQSPPTIALGKNTFDTSGMTRTLTDPLLDISFQALEIDFFASIDDQYVRVFTAVADVHLPIGLDVGADGTLTPVLGDVSNAFTNVSVKNSEAVTESPAELAGLFPTLLNLVLPQLSGGLSPISLPTIGGLKLSVNDITSVDDVDSDGKGDFLAIFANLAPATMARTRVETTFDITSIEEPSDAIARSPARWRDSKPPAVTLALGATLPGGAPATGPLQFSLRIDDGSWTPWSPDPTPVLAPQTFWLPGIHHIEARARLAGDPDSADPTPAVLALPLGTSLLPAPPPSATARLGDPNTGKDDFHGQAGAAGCACNTGGGAGAAGPFGLVLIGMLVPWRRARRRVGRRAKALARGALRLGPLVWLVAIACLPGCSCGSKPCGDTDCMAGTLTGSIGRWTSIAGDDQRVMIATYDEQYGDLVVADATDPANLAFKSVDGVPSDATPVYDPSTWRGGIVEEGPKVGAWTSITIGDHKARVSYQDRDANALKYAAEDGDGNWHSYVVDGGNGEQVGLFTSIIMDSDRHPVIAYMAVGADDGMGHRTGELRVARAAAAEPGEADWVITKVASAPASCAGLCTGGEACIAGAAATDPQTCVTATTDCGAACASGEVCSMGACHAVLADPMLVDLPGGTGLFAKLVLLPDGRLAIAFYDATRRALVLDVETAKGTTTFDETVLDGDVAGADRGMWTSAVVAGDGTIHLSYQDALGDELMYTTWNGAPGTPEVVDDGLRAGDRSHPVGAASSIYLAAGAPAIAYQDGMTADVYVASKGAAWTTAPIAQGPLLDGFSIAATSAHNNQPVLAWDTKDPNAMPISSLTVKSQ